MATLRFNKNIYSRGAIDRAAEAYQEMARVTHRSRGGYFEVSIEAAAPGGDQPDVTLTHEFANYVLHATLLERRT